MNPVAEKFEAMTHFTFETSHKTHVGKVRTANEDGCLAAPESGLWLVADGMGGHARGDVASKAVVTGMASLGRPSSAPDLQARFLDRLARANAEIRAAAAAVGGGAMGTTLAALLVFERHFAAIWSGDSRIYLQRGGALQQVSHDHSEVQELVDQGVLKPAEAATWPRRNVITRAIGIDDEIGNMIEMRAGQIEDGDVFLLCSDGLTTHVADAEIEAAVAGVPLDELADRLIETVLERGASDNVTVVALRCSEAALPGEVQAGA